MPEFDKHDWASRGVANSGLGLGIAGTALGILNSGGLNGILGGVNGGCSDDHFVNRYEMKMQQELAAKDSKIALLESNIYVDTKIADVYERLNAKIENKFDCVEKQIAAQAVYNASNNATLSCIQGQIAQLQGLTKVIIPIGNVCPEPMAQYNSWTAPTA